MTVRAYRQIIRRKSRQIMVGKVPVGGDAPITVQSMTNTPTADAKATIDQIRRLEEAGADIVRVSCPDEESTAALARSSGPRRCRSSRTSISTTSARSSRRGGRCVPAHQSRQHRRAKPRARGGEGARDHGCSMRIGVNAGSLERDLLEKYGEPCPEAMVESALNHAKYLEDEGFHEFKISVKASDVFLAVAAYQGLAEACDYPLHLGVTEAGALRMGTVKSSIGIGSLLWAASATRSASRSRPTRSRRSRSATTS
jgi:(E)-4-hydroxy-3-methylbut-2-enyl-diphosphate synthase